MTHLHSCIVSYKRRELTEQTLRSYLSTVAVSYSVVIVDNGSPVEVTDWLAALDVPVVLLGENRYPGYATNRGWERMPSEATLLHRIDNDTEFLPGWCDRVLAAFADPQVGQVGLAAAGDEPWTSMPRWPVGGNSIIRRELYDAGLRYCERPWTAGGTMEDHQLTKDVWAMGWQRGWAAEAIAYLGGGDPEYYAQTRQARGLT
ncbi:glycosyltransferase family 2 protein [Parafrankia sp. FMc2]|uniref:glycosyltransferase family 2 protein n=1 Tax=Parafrankia sp. FMc2 TaxID=3233196 RepID=UPI0034D3D6CA